MTIIERLERDLARSQGIQSFRVYTEDMAAILECVKAQHAFIHLQCENDAELRVLAAARYEAEKKVGLDT